MSDDAALQRQPIVPLHSDFALHLHDDAYLDRFVEVALQILARTGVRVLSEKGLAILAEHGCYADAERRLAHIPADVALGALRRAPRHFVLGSRDGSCDIDLADGRTYTAVSGCGSEVLDWRTGVRRPSIKADVADITRLADYLSSVGFWWPSVGAGDCGATAQLHELDAGWNNTVKHLQGFVQGGREARYAVEMASVVAGDGARLRARPNLSDLVCAVSPLVLDRDGVEAALVFAESGIPVCVCSAPAVGTTAPATLAGTYAQALAEVIAYVSVIECAAPGAPVIGYVLHYYSDPRTGAAVGSQRDDRWRILATELVHHIGLPALTGFSGTDAPTAGSWEAAAECAPSLYVAALSGTELNVGLGIADGGVLWSAEHLVLDDELYHSARSALLDIPFDEEALALDVIDSVGPGGHFLAQPHTRRHLPRLFVRRLAQEIGDDGAYRDPVEVARERALDILEHYRPEPLDEATGAELGRILGAADRELRT